MSIFVQQTALRIRVLTHVSVSGSLDLKLRIKKPDNTVEMWPASAENASQGIIYHDVATANELNVPGTYTLNAFVQFADGRSAYGATATFVVSDLPDP